MPYFNPTPLAALNFQEILVFFCLPILVVLSGSAKFTELVGELTGLSLTSSILEA